MAQFTSTQNFYEFHSTKNEPSTEVSLRVTHLVMSFSRGGRKETILNLTKACKKKGTESFLTCLEAFDSDPDEIRPFFASIMELKKSERGSLSALRQLWLHCRETETNVLHTHDAASQFLASKLKLLLPKLKLIMTFHRSLGFESSSVKDRIRNAMAGVMTSRIVAGTEERCQHYRSENYVSKSRIQKIPFGIDTERFFPNTSDRGEIRTRLGVSDDTVLIGVIGHFGPEKGVDVAIESYKRMLSKGSAVKTLLLVIGEGDEERTELIKNLADSCPNGSVMLQGFKKDVNLWMRGLDLLLHTPRLEAFGLVLIEAMSTQLPVIATNVGGIPDVIRHGENGFLANSESNDSIAGYLGELIASKSRRDEFGAKGLELAHNNFSSGKYAEAYLNLYRNLLTGRR